MTYFSLWCAQTDLNTIAAALLPNLLWFSHVLWGCPNINLADCYQKYIATIFSVFGSFHNIIWNLWLVNVVQLNLNGQFYAPFCLCIECAKTEIEPTHHCNNMATLFWVFRFGHDMSWAVTWVTNQQFNWLWPQQSFNLIQNIYRWLHQEELVPGISFTFQLFPHSTSRQI